MVPSDFYRRNMLGSFQEDGLDIQMRGYLGVETLMWGSDYPHAESTVPRSREIVERVLQGVPAREKALIAGETVPNCSKSPRRSALPSACLVVYIQQDFRLFPDPLFLAVPVRGVDRRLHGQYHPVLTIRVQITPLPDVEIPLHPSQEVGLKPCESKLAASTL